MKRLSVFGAVGVLVTVLIFEISRTPSLGQIQQSLPPADHIVLDRNGEIVDDLSAPGPVRRLPWVPLDQTSKSLVSFLQDLYPWPFQLSMVTLERLEPFVPTSKWDYIPRAFQVLAFELKWRHVEILETLINVSFYRYDLQGVAAASFGLFDKPPKNLKRSESAILVAMMRDPGSKWKIVRQEACLILYRGDQPEECGLITASHLRSLEKSYRIRPFLKLAPGLAQTLRTSEQGEWIPSTLDRKLQWKAFEAVQDHHGEAAAVVIDNRSGEILVWLGTEITRTADTILQPFLFAQALEQRILTAASPIAINAQSSLTPRQALQRGSKLAAIEILNLVSASEFAQTLAAVGFRKLERPEVYGPSLAVGAIDVDVMEVANSYRTLFNHGRWRPAELSPHNTSTESLRAAFSPETAFLTLDLLPGPCLPGKNWCVGFAHGHTIAVWGQTVGEVPKLYEAIRREIPKPRNPEIEPPPKTLVRLGSEWYLPGTAFEPAIPQDTQIAYPQDRAVLILDEALQKMGPKAFIQIAYPKLDQNIYANGRRLGKAQARMPWTPRPGRHQLEIRDSWGQVISKVRFEVRTPEPLAHNQ